MDEQVGQSDRSRGVGERFLADDLHARPRQCALFGLRRQTLEEKPGDPRAQQGVAQKLQPLVAACADASDRRAMRQGELEQGGIGRRNSSGRQKRRVRRGWSNSAFQRRDRARDTLHPTANRVHPRCVGKAHIIGRAKARTGNDRDLHFPKQIVGHIVAGTEGVAPITFAVQTGDVGEDVERAVGIATGDAGDGVQGGDDDAASPIEIADPVYRRKSCGPVIAARAAYCAIEVGLLVMESCNRPIAAMISASPAA